MKKVTIVMSMLLAIGMFSACSNDDEVNGIGNGSTILIPKDSLVEERLKDIPDCDYTGRLCYEECYKTWVICSYHPGSIDWVDIYYPMNLPDELKIDKEERVDLYFSGKVVEMTNEDIKTQQIPLFGGHKYYYVYLTKVVRAE